MIRIMSSRLRLLVPVLVLCGLGCAVSDSTSEATSAPAEPRTEPIKPGAAEQTGIQEVVPSGHPVVEQSAADLDVWLSQSEGGRVLARALRAHGGWNVWRQVRRLDVELRRDRREAGGGQEEIGETSELRLQLDPLSLELQARDRPTVVAAGASVDLAARLSQGDARVAEARSPPQLAVARAEENVLEAFGHLVAPFTLIAVERSLEYEGVEVDITSAEQFEKLEKVRFLSRRDSQGQQAEFDALAYFDASSHLLRRLLVPAPRSAGFRLMVFSDWKAWTDLGLVLPSRCSVYHLRTLSTHFRRRGPLFDEVVLGLARVSEEREDSGKRERSREGMAEEPREENEGSPQNSPVDPETGA